MRSKIFSNLRSLKTNSKDLWHPRLILIKRISKINARPSPRWLLLTIWLKWQLFGDVMVCTWLHHLQHARYDDVITAMTSSPVRVSSGYDKWNWGSDVESSSDQDLFLSTPSWRSGTTLLVRRTPPNDARHMSRVNRWRHHLTFSSSSPDLTWTRAGRLADNSMAGPLSSK